MTTLRLAELIAPLAVDSDCAAGLPTMEPLRFEPSLFAAAGDYVYATVNMEYKVWANGKMLVMSDIVHKFKLLDGRIVGVRIPEDTEHTREVLAG